jgi:hypothetical protein
MRYNNDMQNFCIAKENITLTFTIYLKIIKIKMLFKGYHK